MRVWALAGLPSGDSNLLADTIILNTVPPADICVATGNLLDSPKKAAEMLGDLVRPHMPVVWVLGNQDYFGSSIDAALLEASAAAHQNGLHLLDDSVAEIAGSRFIGATLWSDFKLYAQGDPQRRQSTMERVRMVDESYARIGAGAAEFLPAHASRLHAISRNSIERHLQQSYAGKTIVVTHHVPHPHSSLPGDHGSQLHAAHASDLSAMIECHQPDMWLHGHVHKRFDLAIGKTQIIGVPGCDRGSLGIVIDIPS